MERIKAAFFDRDGTLIEDVNYLSSLDQIKIFEPVIDLVLYLQNQGYKIFVITNQSGVARGFFDEAFVKKTHLFLDKILKKRNVFVESYYYCPHHPKNATNEKYLVACDCRKPSPGLLYRASEDFDIDLQKSLMFGDKESDIDAGVNAGCKSFFIQEFLKNDFKDFKQIIEKG